jgi:murein DD-endopeptidase MepM/ murein hydrolase activator NlpD
MLVHMRTLLAIAALLASAAPAAAAGWRWPVRGEVITPFVLGADRFAPGQHRGIDVAARAGAEVRAPCTGRVRFAGRLPGRGRGVTIACGRLLATITELGAASVARGDTAIAGTPIGTAAASHVQLGARRAGEPHGYLDPRALLAGDGGASPRVVPPLGRPPEGPRPAAAWAGLALLGAGAPAGAGWRRRGARRWSIASAAPWPSSSRRRSST